jgi:large subunit ribosomal protein L7/L12
MVISTMDIDSLIESLIQAELKESNLDLLAVKVSCHLLARVHLEMTGVDQKSYHGVLNAFSGEIIELSGSKPKYGLEETLSRFILALQEVESFRERLEHGPGSLSWFLTSLDEVADAWVEVGAQIFEDAERFCEDPESELLPIEARLNRDRLVPYYPEEDSRKFRVVLEEVGTEKAKIGREIRTLVQGIGLIEAVELVSSTPATILKGVSKEQAEMAKALLEAMGAKVSINQI